MTDVVTNLNEVRARIAAAEKAASRAAGREALVAG